MILRLASLIALVTTFRDVVAEIAPEITIVSDGYNVIAKLPCIACPYLYQDTSKGKDEPWTERTDGNALLLNISLPFDSTHLSINDAALLSESKILPRIYVNQVLLDTSKDELEKMIATNSLDSLGGAYFGASYAYTLQRIKSSSALLFHLDIMQLWTDLTPSPLTVVLDDPAQKVLELVLLSRPIQSAADASDRYEMVRASLIPRPQVISSTKKGSRKTMWFLDWDAHGKKGTPAHALNIASESFETYVTSGVWALVVFILAIMALFILIFLFCIFACGWGGDDYERAQRGKRGGKTGGGNDVEKARRFLSPEELGLRGSGQVVGVGKSD